eukprot:gene17172-20455_t
MGLVKEDFYFYFYFCLDLYFYFYYVHHSIFFRHCSLSVNRHLCSCSLSASYRTWNLDWFFTKQHSRPSKSGFVISAPPPFESGVSASNHATSLCEDLITPYFGMPLVGVQLISIDQTGTTQYARGNMLAAKSFSVDLANVNLFFGINSKENHCYQEKLQPFSVTKSDQMFKNIKYFTISKQGVVKFKTQADDDYLTFNATCNGNVLSGSVNGKSYMFHLSEAKYERLGENCKPSPLPEPVLKDDPGVEITYKVVNQWTEKDVKYSYVSGLIHNTAKASFITSLTLYSKQPLKDATSSMWRMNPLETAGEYGYPTTQPPIGPGQTYGFYFITSSDTPSFEIIHGKACAPGSACWDKKCVKVAGVGEHCIDTTNPEDLGWQHADVVVLCDSRIRNLECWANGPVVAGKPTNGTCKVTALAATGEPCDPTFPDYCHDGICANTTKVCEMPAKAPCYSEVDCLWGEFCNSTTRTCAKRVTDEPCHTVMQNCLGNKVCQPISMSSYYGVCRNFGEGKAGDLCSIGAVGFCNMTNFMCQLANLEKDPWGVCSPIVTMTNKTCNIDKECDKNHPICQLTTNTTGFCGQDQVYSEQCGADTIAYNECKLKNKCRGVACEVKYCQNEYNCFVGSCTNFALDKMACAEKPVCIRPEVTDTPMPSPTQVPVTKIPTEVDPSSASTYTSSIILLFIALSINLLL